MLQGQTIDHQAPVTTDVHSTLHRRSKRKKGHLSTFFFWNHWRSLISKHWQAEKCPSQKTSAEVNCLRPAKTCAIRLCAQTTNRWLKLASSWAPRSRVQWIDTRQWHLNVLPAQLHQFSSSERQCPSDEMSPVCQQVQTKVTTCQAVLFGSFQHDKATSDEEKSLGFLMSHKRCKISHHFIGESKRWRLQGNAWERFHNAPEQQVGSGVQCHSRLPSQQQRHRNDK